MKPIEQILKEAVDSRTDGLAKVRARLHREIAAERRREQFILLSIPRPVRAAAALVAVGLGTFFIWHLTHKTCALPLCPHAVAAEPATGKNPYIAGQGADFLEHPERYDRICYCRPRYSGSLR